MEYEVTGKLLNITQIPLELAGDLIERLRVFIRTKIACDKRSSNDWLVVMRASRICYELHTQKKITSMDKWDVAVLYDLKIEVDTEWLFGILNKTRWGLLDTPVDNIIEADTLMKTLDWTMRS